MAEPKKTLLLILDGWGIAPDSEGNCVRNAVTPHLDRLLADYPSTRLACSGRAVGLPDGFMGNSEVGHMNIGGGRVIYQDMTRIDMAIEDGSIMENVALKELMARTRAGSGRLHLMGLVSDGGVHSHHNHIHALLEMARREGVAEVFVHVFLDGRDTPPSSGLEYTRQLMERMDTLGVGRVATVCGRYWAMDRDKHWERNQVAYRALVCGEGVVMADPLTGIRAAYGAGETDEFVKPGVIDGVNGTIGDGDGLFFFNFRADRARQISRAIFDPAFGEFERPTVPRLAGFATMTRYEEASPLPAAFAPQSYEGTLGEVVSGLGLRQLRIAETEKYAHVTYFFNCGREEPFPGEDRVMIPSPREVDTYDLKPQMSADEVADALIARLPDHDLCVCNLANLDMVGHTGIMDAAIAACVTVDHCVGRIVDAVLGLGGRVLLTADHGNAEQMLAEDGTPHTAHSTNPVPLVLIEEGCRGATLDQGILGDIAPTILALWGVDAPAAMTGRNLASKG
ncbi:MAG: 2,3-bisphosphoglycerate-independent phosphoglycerate mutase [Pseudodesulfovibrio sp.]|uniref:2,3-bisphosphoglycerate-independent phosphoglycerate mutase n=1 Tax=Pseudodesulfovibrio aespoeensis (strain ATCC 700646 / DSM 10631 / Aspo-2) TaxID=643562 RepID=E6VZ31_PSEA9|nr:MULTISPECIES: 2,3-bisphosphoglycerate-independent phosphoglycerate mutase [Pseudodesulfovibrio]MBU4191528.1 2,3-bisphosphoglycerate-independent phosphoglycerate mutase [Pseudomonadota bacterium]ADU62807.1 phosphoglycerate mutase, 2,3-bisphosphoglycerate-independent [Pseudodesulfovibrio aespoeensis Aspo-2]MBU4245317.1 2,3-bisphosphoglycerate-independent phosphoglycerate mutase [Pseudomonadota bacterium]MBU4379380.1 2,3-bisphosphoglycerate-independent phosphoglycerate mutase [Pseudomonadota ba